MRSDVSVGLLPRLFMALLALLTVLALSVTIVSSGLLGGLDVAAAQEEDSDDDSDDDSDAGSGGETDFEEAPAGGVETGFGGTAEDGSEALWMAAGAGLIAAGAGVVAYRRRVDSTE